MDLEGTEALGEEVGTKVTEIHCSCMKFSKLLMKIKEKENTMFYAFVQRLEAEFTQGSFRSLI